MSKLTDIKSRIDQLDGGAFQNFCDAYLSCRGYKNGYSLGMNTGTDKTTKGNPDTYFLTANDNYIFVMYTTQKTDFMKKAIEDINKCLDSEKTGIPVDNVAEIIYCHTYGRLKPGDDQYLRQYCENRGAPLTLIGLDELGSDVFCKYPFLSKDFLGVSIDSGQILPLDIFVRDHDANIMSAPLGTEFLFRTEELQEATTALYDKDVLLIAGPAGVGKTRFALELCHQLSEEKGYVVLVIKNKNLPLYEDLIASIESGNEYLVLVDDANELSGLHHVLDYLPRVGTESRHVAKLILTVRDYARRQVIQNIMEITKPATLKLSPFKDDAIGKLMEACYRITNRVYTDRIVAIAEGNARLAMLAGKLASESENLSAIQDASDLYHNYYSKQIDRLIKSETGIISAGIIAFIQVVHLEHLENLKPIFDISKITDDDFITDLKSLHETEIVDLCNDKAARISDQSFSNFLIKYVFVEQKVIPLSIMIETCFQVNKGRTIEACNILLNVFSDQGVREYVEDQINLVWNKLEHNPELFWPFFKAFYMVRPTETLILVQMKIEQEPSHSFDVRTLTLKDDRPDHNISDDILQILGSFEDHSDLPTALELLLLYYEKRLDLFEQFYSILAGRFEVSLDSPRFGYYTQSTVVQHLCNAVEVNPDDMNLLYLFIRVADHFLKLDVSKAESGRRNTISFYTLALPPDQPVLEYRKKLILAIHQIYQRGYMQTEIEYILSQYGICHYDADTSLEVIHAEFEEILNLFSLFQVENLYHCVIAEQIQKTASRIEYDASHILAPFLNSEKYQIYSTLYCDSTKYLSLEYEQSTQAHKKDVRNLVKDYTPQDVECLLQVCIESIQLFDKDERNLIIGLQYVFDAIKDRASLFLYLTESYIQADTPYNVGAGSIVENLFSFMPVQEVKTFITKRHFRQQNTWLWYFYTRMPEDKISQLWVNDLFNYLNAPDKTLISSPYRWLESLQRYTAIDSKIYLKALRIITDHYEDSPFVFSLYVFDILNHNSPKDIDKVLSKFAGELPLLEEVYIKGIFYSNQADHDGALLHALITLDPKFLYKYFDTLVSIHKKDRFNRSFDHTQLLRIWDTECYIKLADAVFDHLCKNRDEIHWLNHSPLHIILHNEAEHPERIAKQERWIAHIIEQYGSDEMRMYELFYAIGELPDIRRKKSIEKFLAYNSDPNMFELLPLEPLCIGGWGSQIPYMQARIDYLSSLLPSVSGLKYLKQKQRIEHDIEMWRAQIRSEEVRELLESWYR